MQNFLDKKQNPLHDLWCIVLVIALLKRHPGGWHLFNSTGVKGSKRRRYLLSYARAVEEVRDVEVASE
jgi:hypothetical protein